MTGTILESSLQMVARRIYLLRLLRRQALCWIMLIGPGIALALMLPPSNSMFSMTMLSLAGMTVAALFWTRWRLASPTATETAQLVEQQHPELNDAVITAVKVHEEAAHDSVRSIMTAWAIDEANRMAQDSDWRSVVPGHRVLSWTVVSMLTFAFLVSSVMAASRWGHPNSPDFANPGTTAANVDGTSEKNGDTALTDRKSVV